MIPFAQEFSLKAIAVESAAEARELKAQALQSAVEAREAKWQLLLDEAEASNEAYQHRLAVAEQALEEASELRALQGYLRDGHPGEAGKGMAESHHSSALWHQEAQIKLQVNPAAVRGVQGMENKAAASQGIGVGDPWVNAVDDPARVQVMQDARSLHERFKVKCPGAA